ncbi:sodium transporter [Leptospira perolatii]|uniref:Sodium transporter n=1 Tax=Leptospira perolatii TaxID=2023191 RepID=A0A2M9ZM25_9LEPT|nr:sodium:solute symporter family protein [Leptospira perolatii]PJZ69169.1 sodium transporter [Leptospira perolatii]PJZ73087.1 sodium transporter [Leptospira perolatii]
MFSTLDWILIIIYLVFAFATGVALSSKAGKSLSSYFVADRKLPWWWLGTSMVATTFAADTPLVITGVVANDGVSGNWLWWSWALGYMTMTVFFASLWRRVEVLTDVELTELRYSGNSAVILRAAKAFFLSLLFNSIILGWVFKAMSKITQPFLDWKVLLGSGLYGAVETIWPSFLVFDNLNNTITVLVLLTVVVGYSSLGGIQGVILTDLFQFALGMGGAIVFAIYAVLHVGGLDGLFSKLANIYPGRSEEILSFWPSFGEGAHQLPLKVFLVFIGIQWWIQYYSDGTGYLAQRLHTASNPRQAELGSLWFNFANFVLRTWPWVFTGLVCLVVFPLAQADLFFPEGKLVQTDREMAYPVLMKVILPSGLLGLVFASLMAAFMSTADTHINWGASYLVNDLYLRFLKPNANDKQMVRASRIAVILMAIISVLVATQMNSIESAWKFFLALASGMGLPQILRWIWWRANAWTELSGMGTALLLSLILYPSFPEVRSEYLLFWTAIGSVIVSLIVTYLTSPVSDPILESFVKRAKPYGFWGKWGGETFRRDFYIRVRIWLISSLSLYALLFGTGYLFRKEFWLAALYLAIASVSATYSIYLWKAKVDD